METVIEDLGKISVTVEKDYHTLNKEYEKLTVVEEEGAFKTYLSRKPVPKNTPLTNRDYWIPFSGVLESISFDYAKFKRDYGSGDALDDEAIKNRTIADGSITNDKIVDDTIGEEKLSSVFRNTIMNNTELIGATPFFESDNAINLSKNEGFSTEQFVLANEYNNFTITNETNPDIPIIFSPKYTRKCVYERAGGFQSGFWIKTAPESMTKVSIGFWINTDEVDIQQIYFYPNQSYLFYFSLPEDKKEGIYEGVSYGCYVKSIVYKEHNWKYISLFYDNFEEGPLWILLKTQHGAEYIGNTTYFSNLTIVKDKAIKLSPYSYYSSHSVSSMSSDVINLKTDVTEIKKVVVPKTNSAHLDLTDGAVSYIISPYNNYYYIKTSFKLSRTFGLGNSSCFCFVKVSLVSKSTKQETVIHNCTDDICPANYNSSFMGGNHGNSDCMVITMTNHGKTAIDIGSIWEDSSNNECVLVGVPDDDHLWFFGPNTLTYPKFTFKKDIFTAGVTLTHKSGATHTDNIVIASSQFKQWWCGITKPTLTIVIDGDTITESGDYTFNQLSVCEDYDVINPASAIEQIKNNVGTYTTTPNPGEITTADKVTRHSLIYQFDSAKDWKIITNFIAYQNINLTYFGFTQQDVLVGSNVKMYIPKTLPISNGSDTIDFRTIADYNTVPSSMAITSTYWEKPLFPPDRWLQYSENIGIHSGFLFDYGVGGNDRKNNVNTAFSLYNTRKCYPYGIDSKITVNAGNSFTAVVWRSYLDRTQINVNGIISKNVIEYNNTCYIYGDFNAIGIYEIEIPAKYIGKPISVFEQSSNVVLLTKIASKKILVKVLTNNPMYGYIVASIYNQL